MKWKKSRQENLLQNYQAFFSDENSSDEKAALTEKNGNIKINTGAANVLNAFSSTIISNLNMPYYPVSESISNEINDPLLKSTPKYKDHSTIKATEKV